MHKEDIAKLFNMEVREKKRIGSNIFKRVSTRKGGVNMSSMRVPSQKEQKQLSGKMEVFNMNNIIPYNEFLTKSESDQKMLLKHWREKYTNKEIERGMGVDHNRLYRLLIKLQIIVPKKTEKKHSPLELTDNQLEELLQDKDNLYSFEKFKRLVVWQQDMLLQEYVDRYEGVLLRLVEHWEGSDSAFLYYVRSKIKKQANKPKEESIEQITPESEIKVIEPVVESNEEPTVINVETGIHDVNIKMNKIEEEKGNSFSFKLNGHYHKDSIIRRLNLLIQEIEETEDMLKIDISIEG